MLPQSTADLYRSQQRLTVATLTAVRGQWRQVGTEFTLSWRKVGPRIVTLVAAGQLGAARAGAAYVPAVLAETDQRDDPVGDVDARAFSGVASDGRPLDSLTEGAVVAAKQAAAGGAGASQARAAGGRWLDMMVATQLADAARLAAGVAIAARPTVTGYVRMLNTPSCSRCVVLAGKWFRWNQGFLRHPQCDCLHIPAAEDRADDFRTDPRKAIEQGQVTGLSDADRRAIVEDGADPSQVINATTRKGAVYTAGGRTFTREATTRRGLAGSRLGASHGQRIARPTPEQIYGDAEDRADALRLLRRFGYVL